MFARVERLTRSDLFAACRVLWLGFGLTACSQSATSSITCLPGSHVACRCTSDELGMQVCAPEGNAFSACDCATHVKGSELGGRVGTNSSATTATSGAGGDGTAAAGGGGTTQHESAGAGNPAVEAGAGGSPAKGAGAGAPAAGASGAAGPTGGAGGAAGGVGNSAVIVEPSDDAAYLFDQSQLRTYNIVVAAADLATIDAAPVQEEWVPARLEFEGKTYGPYKVRYKGSQGSFKWPCTTMNDGTGPKVSKCSLKLGFDEVDKETRFYGLRKLNFHSMNTDATYMRDRLGYAMFRESGIATSRAAHARVFINGEFEGLFSVVEQIDGRFTRSRFVDGGEGNLYKEVWPTSTDPETYLKALETNEDEQPSVQVMLDFQAAIRHGGSALDPFLDRAYMMRYLAVDRVIMNDDGMMHFYCNPMSSGSGNHNYFWYQEIMGQRVWPIPWDLDHSFDNSPWTHIEPAWWQSAQCTCTRYMTYEYQFPPSCDPLVKQFVAWRADYDAAVDAFLKGPFASAAVSAKLNTWRTQIQEAVVQSSDINGSPSEAEWAEAMQELESKISSAREHRGYAY